MLAGTLAFLIVVPALPRSLGGELATRTGGMLRKFSLSQYWSMYAPNAAQRTRYIRVTSHYEDGHSEDLEECIEEEGGWGTQWAWTKNRRAIWRYRLSREKATRDRAWYLRGVCVREARRNGGVAPKRVEMHSVRRTIRSPSAVRAGKATYGKKQFKKVGSMACSTDLVLRMLAGDGVRP